MYFHSWTELIPTFMITQQWLEEWKQIWLWLEQLISHSKIIWSWNIKTRRFSNHESHLLSRSHTYAIIVILDLKLHQSMWIHWPFFPKTWTKGHWPLDYLWPHVCWGHMCDSTQGSLCPSPMGIHQCMWIQWSILQITTYIHTYYVQNEWSHSLLLNSVQARQKTANKFRF